MSAFFLYLFLILCFGLFIKIIREPKLIFEFPFFMGSIFLIFLGPQAVIIELQQHLVPPGSATPVLLMCFLCLGMTVLGYYIAPVINLGQKLNVPLNTTKLKNIGIIYIFAGYFFLLLLRNNLGSAEDATQWSGIVTIYYQFFQVINIAFPIFLFFSLRKPSFANIFFTILAALPTLYMIIFAGRREPTALFVLTIALTIFYKKPYTPPRAAIIGVLLLTMLIIPAIGDYRKMAEEKGPTVALQTLDLKESFINYFKEGEHLELGVAANIIDSYLFHGLYVYGADYWDRMVFRYVPGQLLGSDFKQSLMIQDKDTVFRNGYKMYTGLTYTGIGDSFKQFGYLGCLFFFFLGGLFRNLWRLSLTTSNPLIQILYMFCVVQALLTVTHATINFLPGIFFNFIFIWVAASFAKENTD